MLVHQNQQQLTLLWKQVDQLQTWLSSVQPEVHTKQWVSDAILPSPLAVACTQAGQQHHVLRCFLAAEDSSGKARCVQVVK